MNHMVEIVRQQYDGNHTGTTDQDGKNNKRIESSQPITMCFQLMNIREV